MAFGFVNVPALVGIGRYNVTLELPSSGGSLPDVRRDLSRLRDRQGHVHRRHPRRRPCGAEAPVVDRRSPPTSPRRCTAVRPSASSSSNCRPKGGDDDTSQPLRDGDVIPVGRTQVPPDIGGLLDATNRALQAIPQDNLRTVVDEADKAVAGLGPELSRIVDGSTSLATRGGQEPGLDHAVDRPVTAGAELPSADGGFDRDLGRPHGVHHRPAQGAGRGVRRPAQHRRARARRGQSAVRPRRPGLTGAAGQPGEPRRDRGDLPLRHRAAARALPAGHRRHVGDRRREREYQAGLQGRLPRLQPEPQPAATLQHRIPAGAATAVAVRRRLSRTARRRVVLPGAAGLDAQCPWRAQHSV